jgi:flagellar protein FliJ
MRPFRFRAQAALELRVKQEEDARRGLARAPDAADRARERIASAASGVAAADQQFLAAQQEGATGWLIGWHQSWMARQRLDVDARKREAAISAVAVERAATSVRDTHRQRRTLERLRDRSHRAYDLEVGRQDVREMNTLAGLRFVAQAREQGGSTNDDRPHDSHEPVRSRRDVDAGGRREQA